MSRVVHAILLLSGVGLVPQYGHAGELPLRADCIVQVDLDWSEVGVRLDASERSRLVPDAMTAAMSHGAEIERPNLATAYPVIDRVYFQFSENCEARLDQADRIMFVIAPYFAYPVHYEIVRDRVNPGPHTIDVWGPYWRDRPLDATR